MAIITYIEHNGTEHQVSVDEGKEWKLAPDIFGDIGNNKMANAFNPALAVDGNGMVHMAFRAFGGG